MDLSSIILSVVILIVSAVISFIYIIIVLSVKKFGGFISRNDPLWFMHLLALVIKNVEANFAANEAYLLIISYYIIDRGEFGIRRIYNNKIERWNDLILRIWRV